MTDAFKVLAYKYVTPEKPEVGATAHSETDWLDGGGFIRKADEIAAWLEGNGGGEIVALTMDCGKTYRTHIWDSKNGFAKDWAGKTFFARIYAGGNAFIEYARHGYHS